jgi:two-component system, OmpR family, sensor histidine kinase SaeS
MMQEDEHIMRQAIRHRIYIYHAGIRARLTLTYAISIVLAVALTYVSYHVTQSAAVGVRLRVYELAAVADLGFLGRMLLAAAVVSLVLGYVIARSLTHRIDALAVGARRIADGDLMARVPVQGDDEVAQLGATFNEMAVRLQESLAAQRTLERAWRDLVGNVAHDLRTPLADIQATVEAIEEGVVEDAPTITQYLGAVGRETRYLGRLIDDLFALCQLDAHQYQIAPQDVYLEEIVQECLASLLAQLEQAGLILVVDLPATLPPVCADRHATRRVLTNILQNARTFTPRGGRITIQGVATEKTIQLEVCDTGPGIPAVDMAPGPDGGPRIFTRFVRGDKARSGGGAGLGLTIARELIHAQGGQLWLNSEHGKETSVGFTLPKAS